MNHHEDFTIVIDTREQRPLSFSLPTVRTALHTGDYSVRCYENAVSVERKSLDDLVQCLCVDRDRFERELERGMFLEYFAVIVEADFSDLAEHHYRSAMSPESAVQSIIAFSVRYRLPVFFCGNRHYAAHVIQSILSKYVREVTGYKPPQAPPPKYAPPAQVQASRTSCALRT